MAVSSRDMEQKLPDDGKAGSFGDGIGAAGDGPLPRYRLRRR
jgi:hypothetical protein